jgi:phage gpG-like protein
MNLHQLQIKIQQMTDDIRDFATNEAPEIAGNVAVPFYKKNFQDEGFTNRSLEKWPEVKRRQSPSRPDRADARRKILTKTGNLARSVQYTTAPGVATVHAEAFSNGFNYAPVHNNGEGSMPKRQFVGESETVNEEIHKKLQRKINEITHSR